MAFLLALVASNLSVVLALPQGLVGGLLGAQPQCPSGKGGLVCCEGISQGEQDTADNGVQETNQVEGTGTRYANCICSSLSKCLSGLALMDIGITLYTNEQLQACRVNADHKIKCCTDLVGFFDHNSSLHTESNQRVVF